jgi:hypothetical protein
MNGVATPVLLEETSSSAEVLILLPDGRVMAPGEAIYPSVADAVAAILRDAQIRWDREHAAPEGPAK